MNGLELLRRVRERAPLGAPLYAYRVADDELETIKTVLLVETVDDDTLRGSTAALFCLYAAEQFCRGYRGGSWAWKLVLEPIQWAPSFGRLSSAVQAGLAYWQRPIVSTKAQQRLIGTLICEGGLPLHVLAEGRDRHLKQFFRALIQRAERYGVSAERFVDELVSMLPAAFRNATVGVLAAELADRVVELRRHLPPTTPADPLDYFRRTEPQRLEGLPLRISDAAFAELLRGLLVQPREQVQAAAIPVRLMTVLIRTRPIRLERHALVARTATAESMAGLLSRAVDDVRCHARISLSLVASTGERHPVAIARLQNDGLFRLESLPLSPIRHERAVDQLVSLSATVGGREIACSEVPGGQPLLPDMPWTFEGDDQDVSVMLDQGSSRSSSESVLVALPPGASLEADSEVVADAGIAALGRPFFHVRGRAVFRTNDDEFVIETRVPTEPQQQHFFVGELVRSGLAGSEYWRGFPELMRAVSGGSRQPVDHANIQVRVVGTRDWRNVGYAIGDVEVRVREGGRTTFRARLKCLPKDTRIELRPSEGAVVVAMQDLLEARLGSGEVSKASGGACKLRLAEETRDTTVNLDLFMHHGRISVAVPTPVKRAEFIGRDGATNGPIVFDRLGQFRALAVSPDAQDGFLLEARIQTRTRWLEIARLENTEAVPYVWELGLERVAEDLANFFANTDDLDTELEVRLISRRGGNALATLKVRRYEAMPIPQRSPDLLEVLLAPGSEERLGTVGLELLEMRIRPLCHPDREPELIPRSGNVWRLRSAEISAEPPWLITGHIRNRVRLRPLLFTPTQRSPNPPSNELERLLLEPRKNVRRSGIEVVLRNLAADWTRPEWDHLCAFLGTLGDLPPTTFDVVDALSRVNRAATATLFRCAGSIDAFRRNWRGMEDLPFMWEAIRISDWEATAESLRKWVVSYAPGLDLQKLTIGALTDVMSQAEAQLTPFLGVLHDLFNRSIPYVNAPAQPYLDRKISPMLVGFLRREAQALLLRHENEWWPRDFEELPHVDIARFFQGLGVAHHQAVLQLPFALGFLAGGDHPLPLSADLLLSLRRVRRFDPAWFEVAHASGFALAGGEWLSRRNA